MTVQHTTIPNAGNFSIWDFSGMKEFFVSHERFLGSTNSIFLLVMSLRDPVTKQLAQMRFWLAMIKAKSTPSEIICHSVNRPFVILVGSFADQQLPTGHGDLHSSEDVFAVPLASSIQQPLDNGRSVLETLSKEFGDFFDFSDTVYTMDCRLSQSHEMRSLRTLLASLHSRVIKEQPQVPRLVSTLVQVLPAWRREHADLPTLTWTNFHSKIRDLVNPLVSEERMKVVATALHNMGEIIFIDEGLLQNVVILDPGWLGVEIFGPALSPENSIQPQLHVKSVTGRVSLSEMQNVYRDWDALSVAHLFEHFELCACNEEGGTVYEFPCLIKMEPLFGLWERDPSFTVYAGLYLKCKDTSDIFSPGLFPQVQVEMRKSFSDDLDDQELTLWSDGVKCCRGEVEVLAEMREPNRTIRILVRSGEHARHECYAMLRQFHQMVSHSVQSFNPGTHVTVHLLSPKQLREHVKDPVTYSVTQVFDAEREGGTVRDDQTGLEESIVDVVCCGCEDLLITACSAPYTIWKEVLLQSRVQVCRMLDPADPFGRDWCLLALQLGLTEEVAAIDQCNDGLSSTEKLLATWDRLVNGTIVTIVDALRGIGRGDVASVIIDGISPFANANSSVVISVPCVTLTSYVC
jgi:death-associated protein kinase